MLYAKNNFHFNHNIHGLNKLYEIENSFKNFFTYIDIHELF